MFSFSHIAIVFLIALLVFGPEKLPEVARLVGKALADFRRASTDFRRVIEDEFTEIERQNREKEELARRKALEASNPATAADASSGSLGQNSRETGNDRGPVSDASVPGAVPQTVARDSDASSSAKTSDSPAAAPADGHPA